MGSFIRTFFTQIRAFFNDLTPTKRLTFIASCAVLLAAFATIAYMASGNEYEVLQSNLPPEQVPTLLNVLRAKNIPYQMVDGKTIKVPRSFLHSTQMLIMTEVGAGRMGQMGLELFDKQDFGTTSYAQKINFQRALQGELQRSINSLEAVNRSKVILVIPNKKVFMESGAVPKASVVLELHPGKRLSEDQVLGVVHLVAHAVEGLNPENITVVNSQGKVLSKKYDAAVAGSAELMDIKNKVESYYEERIESIISKVVGEGRVIARVNADLNPTQVSQVQELVDPDRTAIRSVQTEEETVSGNRSNPTGVPGARANLPGAEEAGRVTFDQNVKREIKTQNYEVPKTVKNVIEAAGTLKKLTVAVMVDGNYQNIKDANGKEVVQWAPRDEDELNRFRTLVVNSIGLDTSRGDAISMESFQFKNEDFSEADRLMRQMHREKLIRFLASWALAALGIFLLYFVFIKPFIRWVTDSFQDSIEDLLPKTIEELEELHGVDSALPGMSGAMPMLDEPLDPEKAESEILKERIMAIMDDDVEKASGAFSLWLVRRDF